MGMREGSGILRYRIDSLGQASTQNLAVWAVDNDAVSFSQVDVTSPWPLVVVTAPVDAQPGGVDNPYAPAVPDGCTAAPVRVLAFDAGGVEEIYFTVDSGALETLTRSSEIPEQYEGHFDATGLSPGLHDLEVHAEGTSGWRQFSIRFAVQDLECDIEPPPVDEDPEPVAEMEEPQPEPGEPEPVPEQVDADTDPGTDAAWDVASEASEWTGQGGSVVGCGCSMVL